MTVIAYKDGIMAADTVTWCMDLVNNDVTMKIIRTPSGELVGCAGGVGVITEFQEWAMAGFPSCSKPKGSDDFVALVVSPDGKVSKYDGEMRRYDSGVVGFIGVHAEFLCGALAAGASAEQAVRLALTHCAYAGGEVQSMRLIG
jgi:hypothetical protein